MRTIVRTMLGIAILIDVLRVFLPSLITIFGQAGGTPAELIGLYALAWFAGPFLAIGVARILGARTLALAAAVLLVAGRAALQFTDGGYPQLYLASATLLAGLCWLTATAIATTDMRPFASGLVWGFALATGLHAALDTVDLAWREGPVPIVMVAVLLIAFLAALPGKAVEPAEGESAPRAWLAVGPAILLWGLYAGNTAHAQASAGWSVLAAAIVVTVAGFLATAVVAQPRRWTGHPAIAATVLVASAAVFAFGESTVDGVHGVAPWWTVAAQAIGALALAGCLGWAAGSTLAGGDYPYRRGLALAGGLLFFVVLVFAYYAAYDLFLPNDYVPILAAATVGLLATVRVAGRRPERAALTPLLGAVPAAPTPLVGAGAAALVAALAVAAIPLWKAPVVGPRPPADGLRIAAYNIRMGFGLDGTFTADQQADALRGLDAHVIVLSEVDRAWLLNGGHDDLRLIAERLGMRYVWAPATDEVWGDALLTKLPITSIRNHVLVQGGPTGAQALEIGLRWNDRDLTVIATHLQPPSGWRELDQVEQLADIVRAAPKPTVVAGDLNLEPGEPAWNALIAAGLTDPLASARPFITIPTPGDAEQIDHILVTGGFAGRDPANPDLPYSDHRPIAVTLVPA